MAWLASHTIWQTVTDFLQTTDDFHKPFVPDARNIAALVAGLVLHLLQRYTQSDYAIIALGVGGGAFFVPLFNILVGFGLKASTSASQAAIFGGCIASVLISLQKSHPSRATSCIIDFDIALVTTPLLLAGVDAGVLINSLLPSWAIALGLVLLLSYMCYRTSLKGVTMHKKEVAKRGTGGSTSSLQAVASSAIVYPWGKMAMLVSLWALFLLVTVAQRAWDRCTWQFAAVVAGELLLCGAAAIWFMTKVHREHNKSVSDAEVALLAGGDSSTARLADVASDLRFSPSVLLTSAVGTAVCGVAAGILGLGGGMLFTPFLLDFNIAPEVATATANLLILFGSSSATVAWFVADSLNLQYAAIYFVLCIAGAVTGIYIIGGYVRRSGRSSLLVFLLAGIMGGGALLTGVFGGIEFAKEVKQGHIEWFHSFC